MSNKPVLDQVAHIIAATIALSPAAIAPNPITFAWAGFCMGLVREITEEGPTVTVQGVKSAVSSWQDLLFWTLGGVTVGLITF